MKDKYKKIEKLDVNNKNILELGCGPFRKYNNSITIDKVDLESVDILADMNEGLAFIPDNSINEIYSYHFLEHIENFEHLMLEIYRVLKKGGKKIGIVPHFSNPHYYSDYTHKISFGLYTFYYMTKIDSLNRKVPTYYNELDFKIREINLIFYSPFRTRHLLKRIYQKLFNLNTFTKEFYEENLCYIFPANAISFILEK